MGARKRPERVVVPVAAEKERDEMVISAAVRPSDRGSTTAALRVDHRTTGSSEREQADGGEEG